MLPSSLTSIYRQYKHDTDVVATWLATTAKHLGYDASKFTLSRQTSSRTQDTKHANLAGKASQTHNESLKIDSSSTHGRRRFVLAIRDFVPLARYIASQPRRVRITSSFSTAIDRAVHARADFHVLLSKYGNITDDTADSRHSHFAGILGAVRDLLRPLTLPSVPVMTGTCRTLGDKKLYYFNSFTPLTVYDTPDMDETVGGNMIAQPVYEAEREDTFEDACWAFSILLHDFTALRMQVKNLWERYARRELHLGSVAIATNAAIQIARSLEEDVEHLFAAHGGAHIIQKQWYGILCDDAGHDSRPEPGELLNWEAYRLADDCFLPANLMIAMFFEAYALGKMHHYNGNFDWYGELAEAIDHKTEFFQGKAALSEILMETAVVFHVLSDKETIHCRDEFSLAILAMLDCTRPSVPLSLSLAGTMYLDSLVILKGQLDRP